MLISTNRIEFILSRTFSIMVKGSKPIDIIKNKKIERDFEPSTKTLSRILKTLKNKGPESKTILSVDANLNYTRFAKHIVWLEKKGFVEATIGDSQIKIGLTPKGRQFTSLLSDDD